MKSSIRDSLRKVLASFALLGMVTGSAAASELRVFAAASLTDVMEAIAKKFESQSGDHIRFNFAGSNVLARQILEGAPVDIFVSADEAEMDAVSKSGLLVENSRHDLLSNKLVVIVPQGSGLELHSASDLANARFKRIALGDPRMVPAGVYAKAYLEKEGIWDSLRDKVLPAVDVRAALAAVASGDAEVGIVYKTDALISKKTKIVYEIPTERAPRILYPVAIAKDSQNLAEAEKFLKYLESPDAASIFTQYGFVVAK